MVKTKEITEEIQPPLPPIETLPNEEIIELEKVDESNNLVNEEAEGEEAVEGEGEGEAEELTAEETKVAGVHKGKDDWQAIWSQEFV